MHTHATDPDPSVYSEALSNARLTALRALLEIINTTTSETEKRHAAVAILRAPDPNAPAPARTPRRHHAARPASAPPAAPSEPPHPDPAAAHSCTPRSTREIDTRLRDAELILNSPLLRDFAARLSKLPDLPDLPDPSDLPDICDLSDLHDLPDLDFQSAAATLATRAGGIPQSAPP
jgi:hypothetical protein